MDDPGAQDLQAHVHEELCYLTTTGRRTGAPHTIEIWFAPHDGAFFLLAGGRASSDWVQNLRADPQGRLRVGAAEAPVVADEPPESDVVQAVARTALREKYAYEGDDLVDWARDSLLVRLTPTAG